MRVDGVDRMAEAYRIRLDDGTKGLVPEGLVAEMLNLDRRPGHKEVYRWIERHKSDVEAALVKQKSGKAPRPPFDRITLGGD